MELYSQLPASRVLYGLSNGAIFNHFERLQTHISKSRHYLTLNKP